MPVQQGLGRPHGARRRPASRRQLHRAREKPVEWTPQQVKAFRWMVTAQSPGRIGTKIYSPRTQRCGLRSQPDWLRRGRARRVVGDSRRGRANAATPIPKNPCPGVGELRVCGKHRVRCGRCNPVGRCRAPPCRTQAGMVADPPSAIELDSEWPDCAGLNGRGPAEPSYVPDQGSTMP